MVEAVAAIECGPPVTEKSRDKFQYLSESGCRGHYAGRQLRRQQPVVSGLGGRHAKRRHSTDDGRRTQAASFERYPPWRCLGETGPRCSASGETRMSEDFVQGVRVIGSIGPKTLFPATLAGLVKVIEKPLGAVVG